MALQKIEKGLVVLLDALGVSRFSIGECADFVRKRDEITDGALKSYLLDDNCELFKNSLRPTVSAQFGDTLLYAWNFDDKSDVAKSVFIDTLMMWLADLLSSGIEQQVYYRGAISFGQLLIADNNTVLGPAVTDAAAWYEQADWFGAVATPLCGYTFDYFKLVREDISPGDYGKELSKISHDTLNISMAAEIWAKALVRYKVPLHEGEKEMWAVSWPYAKHRNEKNKIGNTKKALFAAISVLPKSLPRGVERKYENSIKFFDHCISEAINQ